MNALSRNMAWVPASANQIMRLKDATGKRVYYMKKRRSNNVYINYLYYMWLFGFWIV